MFKKIFALALILVLVALCTRRPLDGRLAGKLPMACSSTQFAAAIDEFDALSVRRDQALAHIESLPTDEPLEYVSRWKKDVEVLADLDNQADRISVPRCLRHAQELFEYYLGQSHAAAELRAPDKDFTDYARAKETSESILAQYKAEVKLQEKNRE